MILATVSGMSCHLADSIFGGSAAVLEMPAAWQLASPLGVNIGGVDPAIVRISADAEYDSWLTVAETAGNPRGAVASIGVDAAAWTVDRHLRVDNGAVCEF